MLVLTRKKHERIMLNGGEIIISVQRVWEGRVSLGIEAPKEISIEREEIIERKKNGEAIINS